MSISCDKTLTFDLVILTLKFDLIFENFNLANKF